MCLHAELPSSGQWPSRKNIRTVFVPVLSTKEDPSPFLIRPGWWADGISYSFAAPDLSSLKIILCARAEPFFFRFPIQPSLSAAIPLYHRPF